MEMVVNNGFQELSFGEMTIVDGGGFASDLWSGVCQGATVAFSGAVVGAKVGAATCTPVGVVAGVVTGAVVGVAWDYWMK